MRHLRLTIALLLVLAALVVAVWWWWVAPPQAAAETLARAAGIAPAAVDGVVVLASPRRAARWLAAHPAAALPLVVAANPAASSFGHLAAAGRALVVAADGPAVAWWRGEHAALAATVDAPAGVALDQVAALQSLACRWRDGTIVIASEPSLLGDGPTAPPSLADPAESLAALVRVGPHWWRVQLGRAWLIARWGEPFEPPGTGESSELQTRDLGRLLGLLGVPGGIVSGAACIELRVPAFWGIRLPGRELPSELGPLLGRSRGSAPAGGCQATLQQGMLGALWVVERPDLVLASEKSVADVLCALPCASEEGRARGADLVFAGDRLAKLASRLPGLGRYDTRWRQLRPWVAALRDVRWRLAERGGVIVMGW